MQNPYAATSTNLDATPTVEEYTPEMFQMNGRIGRIRFLAYCTGVYILTFLVMMVMAVIGGAIGKGAGVVLIVVSMIPMVVGAYIIMRRRLHDLGQSGWYILLTFIPFVGALFMLYIIFAPGEKYTNDYGPKPTKNTTGLWIAGTIFPVIGFIGILAAIAIPQYAEYTKRTRAAQAESQVSE